MSDTFAWICFAGMTVALVIANMEIRMLRKELKREHDVIMGRLGR